MYIKSLELSNIRSYKHEKFNFSRGINFLSGDIGSGKSSILIAIEFLLFGLKSSGLEGSDLLRKGENKAYVLGKFVDNNKVIEIYRELKKNRTTISQQVGYIKIDNNLIELTPNELDASIFKYFNFPLAFLKKNKNLIYRYTIYSAQENLKEILFTDSEKRLEIIRKIFNIDKYKTLNNSLNIFVRELKRKIKNKKEILESLNYNDFDRKELEKKIVKLEKEYKKKEEEYKKAELEYNNLNKNKEELEFEIKNLSNKKFEIKGKLDKIIVFEEQKEDVKKKLQLLIKEKESIENKSKISQINKKLKEIGIEINKQTEKVKELETILKSLDEKILIFKRKETELKEIKEKILSKTTQFKERTSNFKKKYNEYSLLKEELEKINYSIQDLEKKIKEKEKINEELSKLNLDLEELTKNITIYNHKISEFKEKLSNISSKEVCPFCLQKITTDHIKKIKKQFDNEKENFLEKVNNLNIKKSNLEKLVTNLNEKLRQIIKIEGNLESLNNEYNQKKVKLNSLKNELKKEKEELKKLKNQVELLKEKVSRLNLKETKLEQLEKEKNKLSLEKEEVNKKLFLLKEEYNNLEREKEKYEKINKDILELEDKIKKLSLFISKKEEYLKEFNLINKKFNRLEIKYNEIKEILNEKSNKKNELFEEKIDTKTMLNNLKKDFEKVLEIKEKYETLKKEISILESDYNFITNLLVIFLENLEKKVFSKYFGNFYEYFEYYFRQLIEDETIEVRIDDSFMPIIEENGFDIDIKNLSGGEKSSVAISYRLALKTLIEENLKNNLSILILDEPTDGFSDMQIKKLGNILTNLNLEQIILVSHDEKIESIADNIIKIEKINHISKIIN